MIQWPHFPRYLDKYRRRAANTGEAAERPRANTASARHPPECHHFIEAVKIVSFRSFDKYGKDKYKYGKYSCCGSQQNATTFKNVFQCFD